MVGRRLWLLPASRRGCLLPPSLRAALCRGSRSAPAPHRAFFAGLPGPASASPLRAGSPRLLWDPFPASAPRRQPAPRCPSLDLGRGALGFTRVGAGGGEPPKRSRGSGTEPVSRGPPVQAGAALRGCGEAAPVSSAAFPSPGPGQVALRLCPEGRRPEERGSVPGQRGHAAPQRDTEIGEKPRLTCPSRGGEPGLRGGGSASSPGLDARSRGSAEHEGVCRVCTPGSSRGRVLPSGEGAVFPGLCQKSWSPAGRDAVGSGAHPMAGFFSCEGLVSAPSASLADNSFTTYVLKGEIYKNQKE